jgi:hypothetical protein
LPVPVATDPAWALGDTATLDALRQSALAELGTPWPQPLVSQYARYFRDGNRTDYENTVARRQRRLTRAVVLASADGPGERTRWLDEVADGVALLCEQSSWCWAAHEDTCPARGTVVPDVDQPCLDLGAGEVAAQLAWTDHVLGPLLDVRIPGLRDRIRREVRHRVVDPFLTRTDWHWLGLDGDVHNWCPWICGNVLVAALQLTEPGPDRAQAVSDAIAGIDRYLASLPTDGSIDEGYEYWWNGACRALEALDVLAHATGGELDASSIPVVRETVRFPHRMQLGNGWYLNLADAQARPSPDRPWHVLHRWARRLGDSDAAAHAGSHRTSGAPVGTADDGLGRLLGALSDPEWVNAERASPPLVASTWLPGTQVGMVRQRAGSPSGLTLAVKGGHNGEHHNHNDVGSVVVAIDGVPVIVDPGRPTYTAQTFGPDRYEIWCMQSTWHSVPEVGGPQGTGEKYRAHDMTFDDESDRCEIRLDISAAYDAPGFDRWWRTAVLDRLAGSVVVTDEWAFAAAPVAAPVAIHYVLAGTVGALEPGRLLVRPVEGESACLLTWDPALATAALTTRNLDDPMHADVWGDHLTRLDLRVPTGARGHLTLTVKALA